MSQALCNQAITTALSGVAAKAGSFAVEPGPLTNLTLVAEFAYTSGGTSADAYVQTTFDNGVTWFDIANFHFTTASGNKAFNLSRATPITTSLVPAASGSIAANTSQDGFIGGLLRVLLTTVGTYVGTTLAVYAEGTRVRSP